MYAELMENHEMQRIKSHCDNNLDQLPFSSINFGTCTLPEGRMIIKAILETSLDGLGKLHTTPIFPCSIMKLKKGVNRAPGDPN
jgi:ribonucleoside-triphosphate reductase